MPSFLRVYVVYIEVVAVFIKRSGLDSVARGVFVAGPGPEKPIREFCFRQNDDLELFTFRCSELTNSRSLRCAAGCP